MYIYHISFTKQFNKYSDMHNFKMMKRALKIDFKTFYTVFNETKRESACEEKNVSLFHLIR